MKFPQQICTLIFAITCSITFAEDWATFTEKSAYRSTPNYEETMSYIRRVAASAPQMVKLEPFGETGEGRTLWTVIVSGKGMFEPAEVRKANLPVVLIQNGIHAGEIDGKDASLVLLRDMVATKTQAKLLNRVVIVIIPVYNVDGHERISRYNRINQNGPEEMGWRTTAINLNLNRDYMKADCPETRAFLKLWDKWLPDFYIDNHVTDGADYAYDITYSIDHGPDVNPGLAKWVKEAFFPFVNASVRTTGHKISPYIELADPFDPSKGIAIGQSAPRFSTGFAILQNRPGMLVEMHMLKDYRTRVTGNYELLRATLEVVNRDAEQLVRLNRASDASTVESGKNGGKVPLTLAPTGETKPFEYEGFKFRVTDSEVSGTKRIEYTNEPITMTIPIQTTLKIVDQVTTPVAYIIPAQWTKITDVLSAHGIEQQRITKPLTVDVERYRCATPVWSANPFEGRHTASFTGVPMGDAGFNRPVRPSDACKLETDKVTYPAGSVVVPMAQRAAKVALHFLEPEAPDSTVAWGFMDAIFEQKEYPESYVMEKMAREMMAADPKLKEEFDKKLATDKDFASNPIARLGFFYLRTPYYSEQRVGLYPIARLKSLESIGLNSLQTNK